LNIPLSTKLKYCFRAASLCFMNLHGTRSAYHLERKTTVVVFEGVVYRSSGVPAEAGITSCETTLNVFAISYPNAIANAVASSCEAYPALVK